MTKYISNPDNLKLMMNMLREKSRNIQFEAFHVFKVRVREKEKKKCDNENIMAFAGICGQS
jgi:calcium binding protein 39